MGRLTSLKIERVDAVGAPASGHHWAIRKSEKAEDVEKADEIAKGARSVIESLLKQEGVELSDETVEAIKGLAALLDMEVEFKSVDEPADEPKAADEDAEGVEKSDEPITAATLGAAIAEALPAALDALLEKERAEAGGEPVTKGRSKQARTDAPAGETIAKGEGLYEDIIFGQD